METRTIMTVEPNGKKDEVDLIFYIGLSFDKSIYKSVDINALKEIIEEYKNETNLFAEFQRALNIEMRNHVRGSNSINEVFQLLQKIPIIKSEKNKSWDKILFEHALNGYLNTEKTYVYIFDEEYTGD